MVNFCGGFGLIMVRNGSLSECVSDSGGLAKGKLCVEKL